MDAEKTGEMAVQKLKGNIPKSLVHAKSDTIQDMFNLYKPQISQALPKHLTAERMIQIATTVVARNPSIKECSPESIVGAVMQASILGLDVSPVLGECFLIPRKNKYKEHAKEVNFMIGYKGFVKLIRQCEGVSNVFAYAVGANDEFSVELGDTPKVIHKPNLLDPGEYIGAYAIVKFTDGSFVPEYMSKSQIMDVKAKSDAKGSNFSPWNTAFELQMWRKSPLRRVANYLTLSPENRTAVASDDKIVRVDMFDQKLKELDVEQLPKQIEEKPSESTQNKILELADQITEKESKEYLYSQLAKHGVLSYNDIKPDEQENVLELLEMIYLEIDRK